MTQLMVETRDERDYSVSFYRDGHWYVFRCNSETRHECLRMAADPELNLTWNDAAIINDTIRKHVSPNQEQRLPGVGASNESGHTRDRIGPRLLGAFYVGASLAFWFWVVLLFV